MKFKVNENETISECLTRMREEGYMPVKRIENLYTLKMKKGNVVVLRQDIQFVGKSFDLII